MARLLSDEEIQRLMSGKGFTTKVKGSKGFDVKAVNKFMDDVGHGVTLTVGIHEDAGENSGTTIAQIASWQEFGVKTKATTVDGSPWRIPPRPFMRPVIDSQGPKAEKMLAAEIEKIFQGKKKANILTALGRVGAFLAGAIQRKITTLKRPPNAPSTIKKKGSSNPLIDTGAMRQAVGFKVTQGQGEENKE
jgi:hypothetical protein